MEAEILFNTADAVAAADPRYLAMAQALCADVRDIYSVDWKTQIVTIIRQEGEARGIMNAPVKPFSYQEGIRSYIENNVYAPDRARMLEDMRLENLCERLKKESTLSFFYRVDRDDKLKYYRAKCVRFGEADDFDKVLFAFMPEDFGESQHQIIHTLETDELTGLYTKQAFYHRAAELLAENPDREFDLIMADVENFKLVNRNYGRNGGDELLKYMARFYSQAARGGICARYGADQFVVLTDSMSDNELPVFYAQVDKLRTLSPVPFLNIRYGICRRVDRADSVAEMCDKANLALRSRKNFLDESVMFYDREVIQENYRARSYESDFERAIEAREFVVWCQPKYNAFTKIMTSGEALVRWKTAEGKFISPGEFIPVFESDGLIVRLDEYVFRHVCERQKELLDKGLQPLPVSVNLSRTTLFHPGAIERYRGILEEVGIPAKYVPIELTESATIEGAQIAGLIEQLKEAGFELHMDDFGSGYSSLSSLATLRFDCLKLDKSLIDGIGDARGDELLRHIIELAHFFHMEVVAEGVEKGDQYLFLRKLSCDTIQGYLFSKPVPFDEFLLLWASQPDEEYDTVNSGILADEASIGSLRITNDFKLQYLTALAGIYMTMHVVDLKEDTVIEFATTTNVKAHANRAHDAAGQMRETMKATVDPDYVPAVLEFTDLTTIQKRMKGKRTIAAEFVGKHFGWFQTRFVTVTTNENDEPEKLIFTTRVIEADLRKESTVVSVCLTDELTGVFNRTAYDNDLRELDSKGADEDLCVISVDIRGLKNVNDTLGRNAGDELLWSVAVLLNTALGSGSRIYRLEADHFVGIFHADALGLYTIAERYENAVKNWMGNEVRSLSTAYTALSRAQFPDLTMTELIEEADRRRILAKSGTQAQ